MTPDVVMIFAAGRGTRLAPLTDHMPKPLVPVLGRAMLDRALDIIDDAKIARKVVNTHYLAAMIATHLGPRKDVILIEERPEALETGGGLKNALGALGGGAVFTLNPDAIWTGENPLEILARAWDGRKMGALLALVPLGQAAGHQGGGDFSRAPDGRLSRYRAGAGQAYVYTGAQIIDPSGVRYVAKTRFSVNLLWDRLIAENRLFGVLHNGGWVDAGTPEGLQAAETLLQGGRDV